MSHFVPFWRHLFGGSLWLEQVPEEENQLAPKGPTDSVGGTGNTSFSRHDFCLGNKRVRREEEGMLYLIVSIVLYVLMYRYASKLPHDPPGQPVKLRSPVDRRK